MKGVYISTASCYELANLFFMANRGAANETALKLECISRLILLDAVLVKKEDGVIPVLYLAEWMANGKQDPFNGEYDTDVCLSTMAYGHLSNKDLIKKVTTSSSHDLSWIGIQTAVKERLRYLARQVYLLQQAK